MGEPIPFGSEHAVSVSMPEWQDVIDYEEGEARVRTVLKTGYPRFVLNNWVQKLFEDCEVKLASSGYKCFVFPSLLSAQRAQRFVLRNFVVKTSIQPLPNSSMTALIFQEQACEFVKAYWQHSGEIVSSRQAKAFFNSQVQTNEKHSLELIYELSLRIAELVNEAANNIYLYPSGMAAIFSAYRLTQSLQPKAKTVQFGFPYVDTYKIQEKFGTGAYLIKNVDDAGIAELERILRTEKISAVFTEFPTNPLLQNPNLEKLYALTQRHNCLLIVDDTIGTFANLNLLSHCDLLVTSLTKFFTGQGDVMAGSLVLNSKSRFYDDLKNELTEIYENTLWYEDLELLEEHSRDFLKRMQIINANAEALCDWLVEHPNVEKVYYPKFQNPSIYQKFMKSGAGFGGLFSLLLKNASETSPRFFNNLQVYKGPSLGTNYTLACPYTLLAHYTELDFAQSCGVSPWLVRVSVGMEDLDSLKKVFSDSLDL